LAAGLAKDRFRPFSQSGEVRLAQCAAEGTGSDRQQLSAMADKAKTAMGVEALDVLADRGYFSGEEILACEGLGVTPYDGPISGHRHEFYTASTLSGRSELQ